MSFKPLDLTGKVAVVVGGTSGIGWAIAEGLADAGADVVPTSRRQEFVDNAASKIEKRGRRSLRICSDVSERESLDHLRESVLESFGQVDILVNCAGRTRRAPTITFSEP